MKPDCLDMGKDQAPYKGGLAIPSLSPPASCLSLLDALWSPIRPSYSCNRAGVWAERRGTDTRAALLPVRPYPEGLGRQVWILM